MKHKVTCQCGGPTRVTSSGNVDTGTWKKNHKGVKKSWRKAKAVPVYRVIVKCEKGTCGLIQEFTGKSRYFVLAKIGRKIQRDKRLKEIANVDEA